MIQPRESRRRFLATAAGLTVGAASYLLTLLDFSTHWTRTANSLGYASNFFDFQGRALLHGRLAVPPGSLGIEGFIESGREYMYFAPWPAILRLPLLSTTTQYDGKLTLLSMALGFVLMAVMTTRLTWLVRDLMRGAEPVTNFEAVSLGIFLALATGGTTLTYVASLPWAYHEVYVWAVAFAVGAMYWMLRVLRDPSPRTIGWLFAFDLGAILSRTTDGWAVCLATIALGVWLLTGRANPVGRRIGWGAVAAGAVALTAGIGINWIKFRHPYLFPLQDQVWTGVNAHRRATLAANGGGLTGPQFFPTSFMAYFRLDGIRFVDYFPFVTLPAHPAPTYGGAVVDQTYRTGSVTDFMPLMLALTLGAVAVLFRPGVGRERRWLRVPLVSGVLTTGGVMAYGYLAHRYTAEFVPALVVGGAVGVIALTRVLQRRSGWVAWSGLVLVAALTAFSVAANMLVGYSAAAMTAGGPDLARYLSVQHQLTPQAQAAKVTASDSLPVGGTTDDIWIQGHCDALYVNSGDAYDTWLLVERRSLLLEVALATNVKPGRVELVRTTTSEPRSVWLEIGAHDRARVLLVNETGKYAGPWFDVVAPRHIRVGVRDRPEYGYAEVSSNPGGFAGFMRSYEWDANWVSQPIDINPVLHNPAALAARGISVRVEPGITPPLCRQLQTTAAANAVAR